MVNQGRFFIEVANLVMLRVLPTPAACKGTPISLIAQIIQSDHGTISACVQYAIICFAIQLKLPWYSFIVELLLDEIAKKFEFLLWDDDFSRRMSVWLETDSPTGEMIVLKIRSMLENDLNNHHKYLFGAVFDFADGHYFLYTNPEHFNNYFGFVCDCMFPEKNVQELQSQIFKSRKILKKLCVGISDVVEVHSYPLPPQVTDAPVQSFHEPSVPALVPVPQPSATPPVDEPVLIVRVLPDPPPRDDATDLILATVNAALQSCVANAVGMAAKSFDAGNCSTVMAITDAELDAQVLANEVAKSANQEALNAASTASAALEVVGLVTAAADAGETINLDSHPDSPAVKSLIASNAYLGQIQNLQLGMDHQSLPSGFSESVDDASSTIASILHQIEDLKSGTSSPHSPDGEGRAHFTTFAQSPQQCVEDGASRAQPPFSAADLCRSAAGTKSFKSNLGNTPAHPKLIIPFLELTGKIVSPQAQSSDNPSGNVSYLPPPNLLASLDPPLPTQSSSSRGHDIGVGGAHSSDIPSESALFHVDVRWNLHADQPSFSPQGDVGGPPVQVLAQSGDPPGNLGGADHPKSSLSSKLGSDSSTVRTNPPAFLPPPNLFGTNGKPVRPLPPTPVHPSSRGMNIGGSPPLPSSSSPLGGKIGGSPPAHSLGDPPGFVPPSAPSSSSALRSAAPPSAAPLNEKPPTSWGVKIGGTKRSGEMLDIASLMLLGAHLRHIGVPSEQAPLFSHIPPALLAQAVEVA